MAGRCRACHTARASGAGLPSHRERRTCLPRWLVVGNRRRRTEIEGGRSVHHIRARLGCPGRAAPGRGACATGEPARQPCPIRPPLAPPHPPPVRLMSGVVPLSTTRLRTEPYLDHWLLPIPCFN